MKSGLDGEDEEGGSQMKPLVLHALQEWMSRLPDASLHIGPQTFPKGDQVNAEVCSLTLNRTWGNHAFVEGIETCVILSKQSKQKEKSV